MAAPAGWSLLTNGQSTSNSATYTTASFTVAAGALALLTVTSDSINGTSDRGAPTSVGGGAFTKIDEQIVNSNRIISVWRYLGAGFTSTIAMVWANAQDDLAWSVTQQTGPDTSGSNGSGAIGTVSKISGTGTTPSTGTISFSGSGAHTFSALGNGGDTATPVGITSDADFWQMSQTNSSDSSWYTSQEVAIAETQETSCTPTLDGSAVWGMIAFEVKLASTATLDQEGFAFGDADGSETAHTLKTQDADLTAALGTQTLRVLVDATTGDVTGKVLTLRSQKNGAGGYALVPAVASTTYGIPTWQSAATPASGTAAVTWPLPSSFAAGDLLIWIAESANQAIPNAPTGSTEVSASPKGTGTAAATTATRLAVYAKIATGSETTNSAGDAGDHTLVSSFAIRGAHQTLATALHVVAGDTGASSASVTFPGGTTTIDNCLIINIGANAADSAAARGSAWANANLGSVTEQLDFGTASGNGGGIQVVTGTLATAGTIGGTTGTLSAASVQGRITLAICPPVDVVNEVYTSSALADNSTPRLAAPSGKTTGDFATGYIEAEATLVTQSPAASSDYFQFRAYAGGAPLDAYTKTPKWTIGSGGGGGIEGSIAVTLGALATAGDGALRLSGATSVTLGALTSSSSGKLRIVGSDATTLGTLTLSATGSLRVAGATATTLGTVTVSATGALRIAGQTSATLGPLTAASAGLLPIAGQSTASLGALTLSAAGALPIAGLFNATLDALTLAGSGAGVQPVSGSLSATLSTLTLASAGSLRVAGLVSVTLGALAEASAGSLQISGHGTAALGGLTLAGAGFVRIIGQSGVTLGALSLAASGVQQLQGSGSVSVTLGGLDVSSSGVLRLSGQVSAELGELTGAASSSLLIYGASAATLDPLTAMAAGRLWLSGVVDATLGDVALAASGVGVLAPITGKVDAELGLLSLGSVGIYGVRDGQGLPNIYGAGKKRHASTHDDAELQRINEAWDALAETKRIQALRNAEPVAPVQAPSPIPIAPVAPVLTAPAYIELPMPPIVLRPIFDGATTSSVATRAAELELAAARKALAKDKAEREAAALAAVTAAALAQDEEEAIMLVHLIANLL